MVINPYFNNFTNIPEQTLIENLIVESIKIYGHETYYLPRTSQNIDEILNEYEYADFNDNYSVEIYIKSNDSFEGDGNFLSKFANIEIRDQLTITISKRSFETYVGTPHSIVRPREGDLFYIPFLGTAYTIMFVENAMPFFQLGIIQTYDITLEVFEYGNEVFNTGVSLIDTKYNKFFNPDSTTDDIPSDNDIFETEGNQILDFTEQDPFSENWGAYSNYTLTANPGSFILTLISKDNRLIAVTDTFNLTGKDVILKSDRIFNVSSSIFNLTGKDVILSSGNAPLIASTGSFLETGKDIILKKSSFLGCVVGSYNITGFDINISNQTSIIADPASFTLSGKNINFSGNNVLLLSSGSFIETGKDINLNRGLILPLNVGNFINNGKNINLNRGLTLTTTSGSFLETGNIVNLDRNNTLITQGLDTIITQSGDILITQGG